MVLGSPYTTINMHIHPTGAGGEPTWEDIVKALKGVLKKHTGWVDEKEEEPLLSDCQSDE